MTTSHTRKSHEHRRDLGGEYRWGDTGQLLFLMVFIIGMVIDLFLLRISCSWQYLFPWYYRLILFFPLLLIAGFFGQRSHNIIFQQERVHLIVIDTDVYARIRHPMYFASLLTYLAFVILSLSVIAFFIFILVTLFYYYLCRYEENILLKKLGKEYRDYMKKVPMLFPRLL